MSSPAMSTGLVLHIIVCVFGTAAAAFLSIGSIIGIANMKVPWVAALLFGAGALPFVWIVSGIVPWLLNGPNGVPYFVPIALFPWAYTVAFLAGMYFSFGR